MELLVQMVTKHQQFISFTLGLELPRKFPVEKKEKTYEKIRNVFLLNGVYIYFIALTFSI